MIAWVLSFYDFEQNFRHVQAQMKPLHKHQQDENDKQSTQTKKFKEIKEQLKI